MRDSLLGFIVIYDAFKIPHALWIMVPDATCPKHGDWFKPWHVEQRPGDWCQGATGKEHYAQILGAFGAQSQTRSAAWHGASGFGTILDKNAGTHYGPMGFLWMSLFFFVESHLRFDIFSGRGGGLNPIFTMSWVPAEFQHSLRMLPTNRRPFQLHHPNSFDLNIG